MRKILGRKLVKTDSNNDVQKLTQLDKETTLTTENSNQKEQLDKKVKNISESNDKKIDLS